MTRRLAGTLRRALGALSLAALLAGPRVFLILAGLCASGLVGCVGAGDDSSLFSAADGGKSGDARAADASSAAGDARTDAPGDARTDARGTSDAGDATTLGGDGGADATLADGAGGPGGDGGANGDAGSPRLALSSTKVDLGSIGCGLSGSATLDVTNAGGGQLSLSATATSTTPGTTFVVSPTLLVLAAGVTMSLKVTLTAVPAATAAGTVLLGSLNLLTNDPSNRRVAPLPLQATAIGATLKPQLEGPLSVDFPTTRVGTPASPVSWVLVNTGNAQGTFSIALAKTQDRFAVYPFSLAHDTGAGVSATLLPGESWLLTAGFTPAVVGPASTTANISPVAGSFCGDGLTSVSLGGTGTQASLTGAPSSLRFSANCGGMAPAAQTFTLVNSGVVAAQLYASIAPPFSLVIPSTSPIVVPAGGSTGFTVAALPYPTQSATVSTAMPPVLRGTLVLGPQPPSADAGVVAVASAGTDAGRDGGKDAGAVAPPPPPGTFVIALEEDPTGAIVGFADPNPNNTTPPPPPSGGFDPVVLLQQSPPHLINVTNAGNAAAQVTLAVVPNGPADGGGPAFALLGANAAGATTFALPPEPAGGPPSAQPESVSFSPVVVGGNLASLVLSADPSVALCAAVPSALTLSGTGLGFGASVSTADLHFPAPCDGTTVPIAQTFSVTNAGTPDMNWWLSDIAGPGAGQYSVLSVTDAGVLGGSTQPGVLHLLHAGEASSVTIAVRGAMPSARGASATAVPSPEALAAQLTISTDVRLDPPHVVTLHEVPLGERIHVQTRALDFAPSPVARTTAARFFALRNAASSDTPAASLTLTSSNPGVFPVASSPATVAPGTNAAASVAFAPATAVSYVETLAFGTTDLLCDPLPQPIRLTGTGTQGLPVVSTSQLAFGDAADPLGLVNCGSTGASKTFTVSNNGTQSFSIQSLAFAKGPQGPFSAQTPTPLPILVNTGEAVTVTVLPNPIPKSLPNPAAVNDPAAYSDTLSVVTDAANDTPHSIALAMQPRGAIITATPPLNTAWSFGTVSFGSIATLPNAITNVGNSPAQVALTGLSYPSVFTLANRVVLPTGGVTAIIGQFTPNTSNRSWLDEGTLTLTPSTSFCEPLPAQWGGGADGSAGASALVHLSGSSEGSQPPVTFSGSLAFGGTRCGNGPPAPQDITLTNNTNQTYDVNVSFRVGAHYRFSVSGAGDGGAAALGPFGRATITVSPQAVLPGPGVRAGSDDYADSLTVGVGPVASPIATSVFSISWSLSGAVLSLPSGAGDHSANGVSFYVADSTPGGVLPISNGGTDTVSVTFSASSLVTASPNPIDAVAGSSAQALLFSTSSAPACPAQLDPTPVLTRVTLSTPPGAAICQPLANAVVNVFSCVGTVP